MNPLPSAPRIAFVGAGALGLYYGSRLVQAGEDLHFLVRSDYHHLRQHGLHIRSYQGDFQIRPDQAAFYPSSADIGPCDIIFISLKSTSNADLLHILPPLLKPDSLIVTLQNGLGNEAFLAAHFPHHSILGGLCFVCINRTAPGVIHHIAQGAITLGEHNSPALPRTHSLAAKLKNAGIPCQVDDSLQRARWKKLTWNIPFNGLSIAAGGLDTAAILATPALAELVRQLMLEIIHTANQLGHPLPDTLADEMIANTRTMTQYKPSSLIDFQAGRSVELEAIWNHPCRSARQQGHPMPRVETLASLIAAAIHHRPN
jgi:2-dehydropantoate 2-reductase